MKPVWKDVCSGRYEVKRTGCSFLLPALNNCKTESKKVTIILKYKTAMRRVVKLFTDCRILSVPFGAIEDKQDCNHWEEESRPGQSWLHWVYDL